MATLFVDLLPSAIGLAATPAAIAACILMLSASPRPVANAASYAGAFALVYTLLAIVALSMAALPSAPVIDSWTKHLIELIVGLLLFGLGVLLYMRPPDQKEERSKLVDMVAEVQPRRAFTMGLLMAFVNPNVPILLAGLAAIAAHGLAISSQVWGVIFLIAASQIGLAGPVLWYMANPKSATEGLSKIKTWLVRHERALDLGVLWGFGAIFAIQGWLGM